MARVHIQEMIKKHLNSKIIHTLYNTVCNNSIEEDLLSPTLDYKAGVFRLKMPLNFQQKVNTFQAFV